MAEESGGLTQGWNGANVTQLKSNIQDTFDALTKKTDMLDSIYSTVRECWKGPDAEAYLQQVYEKTKALIEEAKKAYENIDTEIDWVASRWANFQSSNVDNASNF